MDPVSCVALATGAFSDFQKIEERSKNPPWWEKTFKGSDEENAILIWNQRRKFDEMRKAIKDEISFVYGPSAWDEVLRIEAEQRRIRKEQAYKKQEFIDNLINWTVGIIAFLVGGALLALAIWIVGKARGRW